MYDAHSRLITSPDLMTRYEPNINGGTLYLFHIESGGIFVGNVDTHRFIELLNGRRTLGEICDAFLAATPQLDPAMVAGRVAETARSLLAQELVVEAGDA